jgi:inosine/xanthosine triphosphate pyrophosphatase family protein
MAVQSLLFGAQFGKGLADAWEIEQGIVSEPMFYFPGIGKTFAELSAEEKALYSHRGAAFRAFLDWYR